MYEQLAADGLIAICGLTLGYFLRRPATERIETVKVERVEVPKIVERLVERVRVEYVDKPAMAEKVRIERVEVPVIVERFERIEVPVIVEKLRVERVETERVVVVEKPVVQVERVDVERVVVVEKPVVRVERVEVERIVEKPVITVERAPTIAGKALDATTMMVELIFMDANESKVKFSEFVDSRLRRATVMRGDVKYSCSRQDAKGNYIYRQVAH